ncbi:PRC-barrel domain-containing protein [Bradyrhizobium sp. DASA03120]|uniref:PRC-barrel domain-containing protein n=1 Tax=Bradyrhizobium sp. SMVTL-02 TaxID=3395917 RepID=UPI003F7294BD
MPRAKAHAAAILREYHKAEAELIGKAVVLTDGKAGTVEELHLDEAHGLRLSITGHPGKWPVSTIKLAEK